MHNVGACRCISRARRAGRPRQGLKQQVITYICHVSVVCQWAQMLNQRLTNRTYRYCKHLASDPTYGNHTEPVTRYAQPSPNPHQLQHPPLNVRHSCPFVHLPTIVHSHYRRVPPTHYRCRFSRMSNTPAPVTGSSNTCCSGLPEPQPPQPQSPGPLRALPAKYICVDLWRCGGVEVWVSWVGRLAMGVGWGRGARVGRGAHSGTAKMRCAVRCGGPHSPTGPAALVPGPPVAPIPDDACGVCWTAWAAGLSHACTRPHLG